MEKNSCVAVPQLLGSKPLVSVIVLNYNGMSFLKCCFDSLRASSYPNVELIMVDNDSSDNSVEFIQKNYSEVRVINSGGNIGYSAANNIGIKSSNGKYVILLNNDVEVTPGWLEPIVEEFESDSNIAACQPKILHLVHKKSFEYAGAAGGFLDIFGYPFLRGRIFYSVENDFGQYDTNIDLFWASGAAIALRKDLVKNSGLLDNDFVHHMEEIDLCWRILLQGYKIRIRTDSVIYHYAGGTIKAESYSKIYWNHRNSLFMMLKNYSLSNLLWILSCRFFLDALLLLKSIFILDVVRIKAIPSAYTWLITHFAMILKKRNEVQKNRKVSDMELKHLFYRRSIVFDYYILRRRKFSDLFYIKVKYGKE